MSYNNNIPSKQEIYVPLLNHVLLLIFTFGIWYLIWIHRVTAFLNRLPYDKRRDPTSQLLLCIFVPFYSIYWIYKTSVLTEHYAAIKATWCEFHGVNLLFAFLMPFIPALLIQEKINTCIAVPTYPPHQNAPRSR